MILIKDLSKRIGVDRSTALRAIKKITGVQIHKVKVKGVGSLMSAIDEKDTKSVETHFGLNTQLVK